MPVARKIKAFYKKVVEDPVMENNLQNLCFLIGIRPEINRGEW